MCQQPITNYDRVRYLDNRIRYIFKRFINKIFSFELRYKENQKDGLIRKLDLIICTEEPEELPTQV